MIFKSTRLQFKNNKSSNKKLSAYLPVADSLFPLLLFFMSLAFASLPQEAELGEGLLFTKITGMYFLLIVLKGDPERAVYNPELIKKYAFIYYLNFKKYAFITLRNMLSSNT